MNALADFQNLAVATAIGFLIGFEREWSDAAEAKERFAGARTFALAGLTGGTATTFAGAGMVAAAGLLCVGALAGASYWIKARADPAAGATTEIALVATYLLGALAASGAPGLAAAGGVGAAILLAAKARVVAAARAIAPKEIAAALRFLAIAVIVLPVLPDREFGPGGAINPRELWGFVVLISGLSFAGYWLVKYFGERGVVMTGVVGGLASSTATTLSIARLVRDGAAGATMGAAGVVAANVVMLARVGAVLFIVSRATLAALWPALLAAAVAGAVAALALARRKPAEAARIDLGNPLDLGPALLFSSLLAAVALAADLLVSRYGGGGFLGLAAVTGLADLDALALSGAAQVNAGALDPRIAGLGILIAITVNMAVKGVLLAAIGGARAGGMALAAFAVMAAAGAAAQFRA
jgi:uncharacterized membrane protein (DUF4010 family)